MLHKALLSDSSISLALHGLKCALALLLNWLVLNEFSQSDYVSWAVTSSILVVATASDLGIGQYATTQIIHADPQRRPALLREALSAMLPLALLATAFVALALQGAPLAYRIGMGVFIGIRVLTIPFGALLNAVNQFKLRKAIEVLVYLLATGLIVAVLAADGPVMWALLVLNGCFMAGAALTVVVSARHVDLRLLRRDRSPRRSALQTYQGSAPYMVNNLTGLLTYGGFIWISSLVLSVEATAKLAVLHSFILINAYQVYEVMLKARQADLAEPRRDHQLWRLNAALMLLCPLIAVASGQTLMALIKAGLEFQTTELITFAVLVALELGFLLVQSIAQVRLALAKYLGQYSIAKLVGQSLAILSAWLFFPATDDITGYLISLCTATLAAYLICRMHIARQLRPRELSAC